MNEMAKLRFKIQGVEFEYIGDDYEIERFVHRLLSRGIQFPPAQTRLPESELIRLPPKPVPQTKQQLDLKTPPDDEVMKYIMSKPNYAHDLFEVQEHFFGRTFSSRGNTTRMYHRTADQLRMVRDAIADSEDGMWKSVLGSGRRKVFTFVKKSPTFATKD